MNKNIYLKILILLSLFIQPSLATYDYYLSTYIPVTNPQSELMDEDGIQLHKALFYTYYSEDDSAINAVTWEYRVNTPHHREDLQNMDINLAHIEGLKVELIYEKNECYVLIDSSKILSDYIPNELEKILSYVKKATKLNMKEHKINCPLKEIKASTNTVDSLPLPQSLKLQEPASGALTKYQSSIKGVPFLSEIFYPLGYSSDGEIAYIKEYDTDPADMVLIRTFVQDLVSDKILWKDEFKVENEIEGVDFKSFWRKKRILISKKLKEYGIESYKKLSFENKTYTYGKEIFSLVSEDTSIFHQNWGQDFLDSSTIMLNTKNKGYKVIDNRHYNKEHILARKAIGFLPLSPNGTRVAVVVANVHRGWEGPPHNLSYDIVGASLTVGFKK